MDGYWLLVAHLTGDYILQSNWMASEKTKGSWPALSHALVYTLPFVILFGMQWEPLVVIGGSHFIIDRWRLARYLCWVKNLPVPSAFRQPWSECQPTGYHKDMPLWLSVWLLIIADNTLHLAINGWAWWFWGLKA